MSAPPRFWVLRAPAASGCFLFDKLRGYENHDVTTILIIIVVTVAIIDRISAAIRTRYT